MLHFHNSNAFGRNLESLARQWATPDGRRENDVLRRMDAQFRLALNVPIAGRGQSNIRMC